LANKYLPNQAIFCFPFPAYIGNVELLHFCLIWELRPRQNTRDREYWCKTFKVLDRWASRQESMTRAKKLFLT
jgi:hypothetical protein